MRTPSRFAPASETRWRGKIIVRTFSADDLKAVLRLLSQHMSVALERRSAFRRRFFMSYILSKPFGLLGREVFWGSIAKRDDGCIIGAIFARRFPFGKSWIVGPVVVHADFRGADVATRLMDLTATQLTRRGARFAILSVETANVRARRFFEKCHFRYVGAAFRDHERARKYVQKLALISGPLTSKPLPAAHSWLRTKQHWAENLVQTDTRTWQVMRRDLHQR